ncbi:hypothetical protein V6N11_051924 [Hibiscus sabdariffa]|uniref:Uncharacterized protein n=1 Tax=Hibiscus sabdariffa TaxID=183260 RepID=A0ABR2U8T6_9ROSI
MSKLSAISAAANFQYQILHRSDSKRNPRAFSSSETKWEKVEMFTFEIDGAVLKPFRNQLCWIFSPVGISLNGPYSRGGHG